MPHTVVIFGASGDLTSRKLIPALYLLSKKGRLPKDTRVVGMSRSPFSHDEWRKELTASTQKFAEKEFDDASWTAFAANVFYHPGDAEKAEDFESLKALLKEIEPAGELTRLYYLSTAPKLYGSTVARLGAAGLADESNGPRRIVIEKPFGTDLPSARALNKECHEVFAEKQIYRIDHYLGKETVQNLLVLRFANTIFEPLWNRNYVDHVQITVAEEVDVGKRGGYYDGSGVLRDMFQNHLLQLMMITAMEAPVRYNADMVRDEKVKVLRAVRPLAGGDFARDTLRGQYDGYATAEGVPAGSQTATFAALKLHVDNWRWNGVPFYLRSGKAMSCRTTQIVIQFRQPPHRVFENSNCRMTENDRLVIHIQPAEGIQLHFQTKVPDAGMQMRLTDLDFRFDEAFQKALPEAYERLLLDVMTGDPSLFARSDEVEYAWGIIDPILNAWQNGDTPPVYEYERGLWGPQQSWDWMQAQGRQWLDVCPVLK